MTPLTPRKSLLRRVSDQLIAARPPGRPLRLGIDGICGAGKTTFARKLAGVIADSGTPVIQLDSDGFHHVRELRYRQGRHSARGYYDDAYDFEALADRVLAPLGPGGDRVIATRVHDLVSDAVIEDETLLVPVDAIVVFDATFLQRGGLRGLWDEVIYLYADEAVATARGVTRDADALGGADAARAAYEARYLAACRIYVNEQDPADRASILIDNTDLAAPRWVTAMSNDRGSGPPPAGW